MARLSRRPAPLSRLQTAISAAAALLLCAGPLATPARAETPALEYAVKANFLYKFAPFVEWPPRVFDGPHSAFRICVSGEDPFGPALDQAVRGQTVSGRPIMIWHLAHIERGVDCQVLFVGRSRGQTPDDVLDLLRGSPVLTVTDERQGVGGGIIHFMLRDGRVRFSIDNAAARAAGLVISAKLLFLATNVHEGGV